MFRITLRPPLSSSSGKVTNRAGLNAMAKTMKSVLAVNQGRTSNPWPVTDVAIEVRLLVS